MNKIVFFALGCILLGAGCTSQTSTATTTSSSPTTSTAQDSALAVKDVPQEGPYSHEIRTASSVDGLTWTSDSDTPIAKHASVPAILTTSDGKINIYYVDATNGPEALGCLQSVDNGASYQTMSCGITGAKTERHVDFSIVQLTDGRYRLYYYSVEGRIDETSQHIVSSAISTDGWNFVEEGAAFTYMGLVDPDVFYNGSQWVMHVMSLSEGTVVATSTDGTTFTYKDILSLDRIGVAKPVTLADGTMRMYGFKQGVQAAFYSYTSTDGFTWTQEPGTRFSAPSGYEITDPSVTQLTDGTWKMVYKINAKKDRDAMKDK